MGALDGEAPVVDDEPSTAEGFHRDAGEGICEDGCGSHRVFRDSQRADRGGEAQLRDARDHVVFVPGIERREGPTEGERQPRGLAGSQRGSRSPCADAPRGVPDLSTGVGIEHVGDPPERIAVLTRRP